MNASELVTEGTEESAAVLDVVGFNYADPDTSSTQSCSRTA